MIRLFALLATCFLLATSAYAQQVRLQWDPNSEEDLAGYRMYRSTVSGSGYQRVGEIPCSGGDAACATFTDTGLVYATTYYYVVTAFNTSGLESGQSNQVSTWIPNPSPPAPPSGLEVAESGVNVSARWSPVRGADYYAVFYRPPTSDEFRLLEIVSATAWSGRLPAPGHRRGGQLGVASLDSGGYSALTTHLFR
jgi:fibronectin type 3 domain-containing protein